MVNLLQSMFNGTSIVKNEQLVGYLEALRPDGYVCYLKISLIMYLIISSFVRYILDLEDKVFHSEG